MCLRLNTSAGAMPASITVQRAALFAGAAMSKAHVTGRANTWSGATMINRRLLIYGAPKAATGGTLTVDNGRTLDTAGAVITFNHYIWQQTMRTGVFFFPCKVLYCGYNVEIEKLPITANIA